jgi:hypothetical protein
MNLPSVSRDALFSLIDNRRDEVQAYLVWAMDNEQRAGTADPLHISMRMENRVDIQHAAESAALFAERWWGIVVFTCFGSRVGAGAAAPYFQRPSPPREATAALEQIAFPPGSVGQHRIQPGHKGAKEALVSACGHHGLLREVLHGGEDFDTRYQPLRRERLRQWGRTTCFDLLVRAGVLGVGGARYLPDIAYLAGSTGPRKGYELVFGEVLSDERAPWGEAVLQAWSLHWRDVADRVGIRWEGEPLYPRDQENFLCIYQERLAKEQRLRE